MVVILGRKICEMVRKKEQRKVSTPLYIYVGAWSCGHDMGQPFDECRKMNTNHIHSLMNKFLNNQRIHACTAPSPAAMTRYL